MTDEDFLKKLREAFAIEAEEHLQAVTAGLLELEQAPPAPRRQEVIETVFRDAHSLKGAARAVSRGDIESLCQALESIFAQWKKKAPPAAPETFDLLNRAIDLLARLLRLPDTATGAAERTEITDMVRQLGGTPAPAGTVPPPAAPAPTPAPAPAATVPPPAPPAPAPRPSAVAAPEPEPAAPAEPEGPQLGGAVRVRMVKLDTLLRRAEEMIAVKLSASRHAAELHALGGVLGAWRKEWGKVRDLTHPGLAGQSPEALARLAGFLEWNQSYMFSTEKRLTALADAAAQHERTAGTLIDDLLTDAKRLLMLPFATLLDVFPKLVRDLARAQDKEIALRLEGRDVEIDKRILHEMKDPLLHLVRNAIDHGLEAPAARRAAHKPAAGQLSLAVTQLDGRKVEIVIADDGAGIDVEKVKASAVRTGAVTADAARALDPVAARALIFASGVSTSAIITEISGRGLGMAIVREKVERLGGTVAIETERGAGTTFRIVLPVTLATFKGVLVSAGGQTFVVPTAKIACIRRLPRAEIRGAGDRETVLHEGAEIPLAWLDETLGLPPRATAGAHLELMVLGPAERRIAFAVDAVLSEQEVLVKNLGKPLLRVRHIAGATILGSGAPALILNAAELLHTAARAAAAPRRTRPQTPSEQSRAILVADDSITSRMLLKNILESAGYRVTTATDGMEALTALKARDYDALVSDVEMPRLDGFGLTAKVRADPRLAELPVVLVTGLGSREHQEHGVAVGANAYIVKGSFDQSNLLEVLRLLV